MSAAIAQTRTAFACLSRHDRSSWPTRRALQLAGALGLAFWVAKGFGGIATGQATDPNSGPLLILLAACFWPPSRSAVTVGGEPAHSPSSLMALP